MWRNDNPWIGEYHGNEMPSPGAVTPKVIMDRYVEDGSYLRCSDITLGYNLPKNLVSKIGFNSIGVYASVKNAFIITNYSGYDLSLIHIWYLPGLNWCIQMLFPIRFI